MKNASLISLIVPVYNGAAFLARCIESVQQQTHAPWELILVDDGSTDDSLTLCQQYASQDKRIRVISQKNQGNCAARNRGIKHAKGALLGFIDQDDWLTPNALQTLLDLHTQTGAEITWGQAANVSDQTALPLHPPKFALPVTYTHLSLEDMLSTTEPWCWNKLYARALFERGLLFDTQLSLGEDIDFIFRAAQLANFLAFTSDIVYIHAVRALSTSHRPQLKRYIDAYCVWEKIHIYIGQHNLHRAQAPVYQQLVNNQADLLLAILLYDIRNEYTDVFRKMRQSFKKNAKNFFCNDSVSLCGKMAVLLPWLNGRLARSVFRCPGLHRYLCTKYEKQIARRC
ncbi:glycosyltransferase family 2 protein [Candidatus Avelusimicrobium caledoniensis]|uniref:glycosyltransferase family 2 protein n=1 Tax=Candidatus Avelusimicrobium caledoniensis TaxID=3416220 RepID=UPI003D112024